MAVWGGGSGVLATLGHSVSGGKNRLCLCHLESGLKAEAKAAEAEAGREEERGGRSGEELPTLRPITRRDLFIFWYRPSYARVTVPTTGIPKTFTVAVSHFLWLGL